MLALQSLNGTPEILGPPLYSSAGQFAQALGRLGHKLPAGNVAFGDDLGRRRRGCGAKVRHEITDREINLMPNRRNDREL